MFTLTNIRYKGILFVESMTIPAEKTTCIVGESGSGKTTLIRLLNKMISPDRGTIQYRGKDLQDIDSVELRKEVVMLPQNPAIYPGTIRDNLTIALTFAQKPAVSETILSSVLSEVGLAKSLDEDAGKLSGGEKQRLALCRILLLEPEVYLLDEPSSALDEETEHLIIEKLVSLAKNRKKTLIMVTHAKKIAQEFAENLIEIKNGQSLPNGVNHG